MTYYGVRKEELESSALGAEGARLVGVNIPGISTTHLQAALEATKVLLDAKLSSGVMSEGIALEARPNLNFSGEGVVVSDNTADNATDIVIAGLGDYPHLETVTQNGTDVGSGAWRILNVTGSGATLTSNAEESRWDLDIPGDIDADIPLATDATVGKLRLSTPAEDSGDPVAVGDNDTRMDDARIPLGHTHLINDLPVASDGEANDAEVVRSTDVRLVNDRAPLDASVDLPAAVAEVILTWKCTSTTRPDLPKVGQLIYETDTGAVLKNDGTPATPDWQPLGGGGSGTPLIIQDEGVSVAQRDTVNLTGEGVTAADDALNLKTLINIPGLKVQSSGTDVGTHAILNVIGATVANDTVNNRVDVTIPGAAAVAEKMTITDFYDNNFVVSGTVAAVPGSTSLTTTIPIQTAYVSATRVISASDSHAFTASRDTYVDLSNAGVLSYTEVTNGAAAPSLVANRVRLFKVVTSGTTITSVADLRPMGRRAGRVRPRAMFAAYLPSDQTIGSSGTAKLQLEAVEFDYDAVFDTTNKRFVAPEPGVYQISANAYWGATVLVNGYIYKNNALYRRLGRSERAMSITAMVTASGAGDFFDIRLDPAASITLIGDAISNRMEGMFIGSTG